MNDGKVGLVFIICCWGYTSHLQFAGTLRYLVNLVLDSTLKFESCWIAIVQSECTNLFLYVFASGKNMGVSFVGGTPFLGWFQRKPTSWCSVLGWFKRKPNGQPHIWGPSQKRHAHLFSHPRLPDAHGATSAAAEAAEPQCRTAARPHAAHQALASGSVLVLEDLIFGVGF